MSTARFTSIPTRAIHDVRISHGGFHVLAVLATFDPFPSFDLFVSKCRKTAGDVLECLDELTEAGYVERRNSFTYHIV